MKFKRLLSLSTTFLVLSMAVNASVLLGQDIVKFSGKVKVNSDGNFEVEFIDPATNPPGSIIMKTDATTEVFGEDGRTTMSLSDIPVGHYVYGEAQHDPAVNMLVAKKIFYTGTNLPPPPPGPQPGDKFMFGGENTELGSDYLVVSWKNEQTGESGSERYSFDKTIPITDEYGNQTAIALRDHIEGEAEILEGGSAKALWIKKFTGGPEPGSRFNYGGEITELGSDYLVVRWYDDQTGESGIHHIFFDTATLITDEYDNPAKLALGDHIDSEAEIQSDGKAKALWIKKFTGGPMPGEEFMFGGEITELGSDYLVVSWKDPQTGESGTDTVYFDTYTEFVDYNNQPAKPVVGYFADGTVEVQADGRFKVISIQLYPPGPEPGDTIRFVAKILSIGPDSLEVEVYEGDGKVQVEKVQRDPSVPVTDKSGNPATLDVLVAGDYIEGEVEILEGGDVKVLWIRVLSEKPPLPGEEEVPFAGTVISVGSDYIEIEVTGPDGSSDTLRLSVDAETILEDESGSIIKLSDYVVGEEVYGKLDPIPEDGQLFADIIRKGAGSGPVVETVRFAGKIVSVGTDYIEAEIMTPEGSPVTGRAIVDANTRLLDEDGTTVLTLANFNEGDEVFGEGIPTDNEWEVTATFIQKGTGPGPGEEIYFTGRIIQVGANSLVVVRTVARDTLTLQVHSETVILDDDEQAIALSDIIPGDIVQGLFLEEIDGSLSLETVMIVIMLPRPGEEVSFEGRIKSIEASRLLVGISDPDSPVPEAYVNVSTQTKIQDTQGIPLSLANLSTGDVIEVEGAMAADGSIAVDASSITYVTGNIRRFFGKVVSLTNEGFDLETKDDQNRTIILKVILSTATTIVREGTQETLTRDQILRGMGVMVLGTVSEESQVQAILVVVPQPRRESFGGWVVSIEESKFVIEAKHPEQDLTFKVIVTTTEATSWFTEEEEDVIQPATAEDLALDYFVSASGVLTGPLTLAADTVWIASVEDFEVMTFTVLEGKVEGSVFAFKINIFEHDPGQPPSLAELTFNISPDFKVLKGQIVFPDDPEPDDISLNKIIGEPGKLTGRWSGVVDENGGVPVSADFVQSGSSVTGTIKHGGTIESDTGEEPQAGDQFTVRGQVTELGENSFILTFRDRLNQELQRPVLFFKSTELVDIEGNKLEIPLDSLLKRKVEITGIIQSDYSLVANLIVVLPLDTGQEPSADLPLIANGAWNPADGTLSFDLEAKSFDEELDGLVNLSGLLGGDGNNLYAAGMLTATDSLNIGLRRQSGEVADPSGTWAGTAATPVSGQLKIWPVFLSLLVKDGTLSGNYSVGESRIKTEIVTQNLPPVISPFEETTATEEQQISVTVTATDPENDPITLTVPGVQIPGSSFTDNGDGTGTYTLTIPLLPEGKTELIVNFVATDSKGAKTSRVLVIKVTRLNRAPELKEVTDTLLLLEGSAFSVFIPVRDPDNDPMSFEFAGLPEWVATDNNQINFDPPFGSAGNYSFTLTVRDGKGGEASQTYNFRVVSVNRPPRFVQIEPIESETGTPVSFTVEAVDPDPGDVLTFSVLEVSGVQVIPQGASFDFTTGQFNWTPATEQVGPFKAAFVVTDSKGARDRMAVNIVVGPGALPPSLVVAPEDSLGVNQGEPVEFTVTGETTTDRPLKFYARHLPRGAKFDSETQTFSWTPDFKQEGNYRMIVGVGDGSFRTEQDVVITVNKVPQIPTLDPLEDQTVTEGKLLRFRVLGSYPDGRQVVFDQPSALPDNSLFDVVIGNFRFLPDYDQAGTYNLTFSVTEDDGSTYSVSTTITVTDNNRPPKLVDLKNVSVILGQSVTFNVQALDPDPGDVLTLEAIEIPQGATFNTTSEPPAFSWTPSIEGSYEATFAVTDASGASDRRTVYITVGTQNLPPVLGEIGDLTISEGDTLSLSISVSDPENDPVTMFVSPVPANATFDNDNNTFSFQPSYAQAGMYYLKFVASDGELTDEKPVTIQVLDVPLPPVISVSKAWSVQEGDTLEFTVDVRDAAGEKVEVISSTLPDGASLEPASGKFFWAPDFEQAGTYSITFIASDGTQTAQQDIVIVISDKNRPPLIFEIADQEVVEGDIISFEITTTDPDGDQVTIAIDSTETPYIESADIRNNSVFVFNTNLLDPSLQIPSAVFVITADDGRGGTDRRAIAFKILRSSEVNVPLISQGDYPFNHNFPGTGLTVNMTNQGSDPVSGDVTGSEISGALDTTQQSGPQLAAKYSYLAKSKDKVVVLPFLAGDDGNIGDFYSIRRGWGVDLSSSLISSLDGLKFDLTFKYEDRDIPARDIPEFTEAAISVFGFSLQGEFIQLATQLDTMENTARAEVDLALYTDFTLGVILDLAEPIIAGTSQLVNTTDEIGPYIISTTIVDNVLIRSAKLYYAIEGQSFQAVEMTPDTVMINGFNGSIPGQKEGNTIFYYIEAGDSLHTVTDPAGAPQSAYRFSILLDGVESLIPGDVDNDGQVNIFDLLGLLKVLGGTQQATGGADTNQDGKVDIFDLLELLKQLAQ